MDKQTMKRYAMVYGVVLIISFFLGSQLGIVQYEWIYNITCDDGSIEWFNESTQVVCGQSNPLHNTTRNNPPYAQGINYLDMFNHSFNRT